MKYSESWLREWVNPALSSQDLMDQVTMAGLEVDGSEAVAGEFSGVVVAEVLSAEQHPNADKLRVCIVSDGSEEYQVVCGAPNARAGIKVAFARVGSVLPGNFKIKKAKLRQVESFGMLCSESELGLSDDHDGIVELPDSLTLGDDIRTALLLDDLSIEVDLTPNRADCLSIRGLAREVATLNKLAVTEPDIQPVVATVDDQFPVTLSAPEACSRYVGRVIKNVDVKAKTPVWMVERLRRSDVRSIDPVVDVTNYVMLELGQPMHGFDLAELNGGIDVRMARPGEVLKLLDGSDVDLTENTLLITDSNGPLAIAGVMGGDHSGISDDTKDIFFESAYFDPIVIAGKARSYGLHTDASHRFERGVDPQLSVLAIERATALLIEIAGGEPGPVVDVKNEEHLPKLREVSLTLANVAQKLGVAIPEAQIEQILTGLGLSILSSDDNVWVFAIPSFRFDISIEADLMEELARVYGYNNIPVSTPTAALPLPAKPEANLSIRTLKQAMVDLGYQEAVTYSFIEPGLQNLFDPKLTPVALANPISSDMAVMRTSMLPGLISALQYNLNRQVDRVRFFEVGLTFVQDDSGALVQDQMIAGVLYGTRQPKGWINDADVDFYDIKGDVERLLGLSLGNAFAFEPTDHSALHPGQSASILLEGKVVGFVGMLHPSLQKTLDLKKSAFVFELNVAAISERKLPKFKELSKFPATSRDIAMLVDENLPVSDMLETISGVAGEYLIEKVIFDVYQGKGIEEGKKSIAMGLTWQHPSRTLNEEEINQWMEDSIQALVSKYKAILRG